MEANGFGLCVRAGFGDENCLPPLNLIRSTELHLTTEPLISCRCCYVFVISFFRFCSCQTSITPSRNNSYFVFQCLVVIKYYFKNPFVSIYLILIGRN